MNLKTIALAVIIFVIVGGGVIGGVNYLDGNDSPDNPANSTATPTVTGTNNTDAPDTSTTTTSENNSTETATETQTTAENDSTATTTETDSTATTTETSTPSPAREIEPRVLESEIQRSVNEYRVENVGSLYKEHDLDQTCKFKNNAGGSILTPGYDARFLAVQQVDVTTANESQLADHIVDEWLNSLEHDDKFDYEHATRLGTGVAIDEWSGKAYVATSVC